MFVRIFGAFAVLLAVAYFFPYPKKADTPDTVYLANEITAHGPALFYLVDDDRRQELWSIHCRQPLRGCVARAPGVVLRLDEQANPWMIAAVSPNAQISVETERRTRRAPDLFAIALSEDRIKQMSTHQSFVVVQENGVQSYRTRTTGMDQIVSYLVWINGETARTLRDARLWPHNDSLSVQNMTPEVLQRYEIMQRRALENQRRRIPRS